MQENDFQLEELENQAVKKSSNAKRIAAAAGLMAAGAGTTLAATAVAGAAGEPALEQPEGVDLQEIAEAGANQVPEAAAPQPTVAQQEVVVETVQQPVAQEDDEMNIKFDTRTTIVDEDGNVEASELKGTVDGHDFVITDIDGDGQGDILKVDVDGNKIYTSDEIAILTPGNQISMNQEVAHDVVIIEPSDDPVIDPTPDPWDDVVDNDIDNDFKEEKTGEVYTDDYAENNKNYINNAEVVSEHDDVIDNDLAYQEDEPGDDYIDDNSADDMALV